MGSLGNRFQRRKDAKQELSQLKRNENAVLVIHYSCESFKGGADGSSPRITSIAVRHVKSGQTKSFAIHQVAERETQGRIDKNNYDELEKQMLQEFYEYVRCHSNHLWFHWNMRNSKYGFEAIAQRCRSLGGTPVDIHKSHDLAGLLVSLYSDRYVPDGVKARLQSIFEQNKMDMIDFMPGAQEAKAAANGEYFSIHKSTLRKVENLCGLLELMANGRLKHDARFIDMYGLDLASFKEFVKEHWVMASLSAVGGVGGVVGFVALIF